MGIVFVFGFYITAVAVVGIPAALVGTLIAGRLARNSGKTTKRIFRIGGVILPLAAGAYLLAFVVAMGCSAWQPGETWDSEMVSN